MLLIGMYYEEAYLFVFSGLLFMMNELLVSWNPKWKEFHFELLANALYLPVIMPILTLAMTALGMTNAPIFGMVFVLSIFPVGVYVTPLFGRIALTRLAGKKASPLGGVVTILVVAALILLIVCMGNPNASVNLQGKQNIIKLPYDDALVYVVDGDTTEYRIYDLNAYPHLKGYADEMTFHREYYSVPGKVEISNEIGTTAYQNVLTVTRSHADALVYVTFSEIQADSFTVDDGITQQTYEFDENETRLITLYSDCTVTLNGDGAKVEYREVIRDHENLIPQEDVGNLHFNLWMQDTYMLAS